jgi:hypothetical protein
MPKHDAIAMLKTDHAAVKKLFEQEEKLGKGAEEKKTALFNEIKAALEVHAVRRQNLSDKLAVELREDLVHLS